MNLAQLKQQLLEAAQKCDDAEAAQRALVILQTARGATTNGNGAAIVSEDGSGMSREEFMRRLRGGA